MFDHTHYVPLLKGKEGEYRALKNLYDTPKSAMTPLVDVQPVRWDFRNERPATSIEAHIKKLPDKLSKSWGSRQPFFIDLYAVQSDTTQDGRSPLSLFCDLARGEGFFDKLQPIPVTGIGRPVD